MGITMHCFVLFGSTLIWALPQGRCAAAVVSTFDSSNEGWVSFQNGGTAVTFVSSGGNSGGYISAIDSSNDWGYVQAPAAFLAPAAYGGDFSFDLRAFTNNSDSWPIAFSVRVGLVGDGLTLINEATVPDGTWTNYLFTLDETAGWRKFSDLDQNYSPGAPTPTMSEMQGALANLSKLVIAVDYTGGSTLTTPAVDEETHLDNVSLDTLISADFDLDGDKDGFDFLSWQRGFGTDAGVGVVAPLADGNANGDQFIDSVDFAIWESQFGTTVPAMAAVVSIPEPSPLLLASLAGLFFCTRMR